LAGLLGDAGLCIQSKGFISIGVAVREKVVNIMQPSLDGPANPNMDAMYGMCVSW